MNRWIFVVNKHEDSKQIIEAIDVFEKRREQGFWGISEDSSYRYALEPKDIVIFYLAGSEGQKFIGEGILTSRYGRLTKEEHKKVYEPPFLVTDLGVKIVIKSWQENEHISVKPLIDILYLTKDKQPEKWGIAFHHTIIKLTYQDYNTIIKSKRATK